MGQAAPHTYQEDTCRWAPEWAFLGIGYVPLKLNEDATAVVAMVATVATELDGTYKIPNNWVSSVNTSKMLIPLFCCQELPSRGGIADAIRLTARSLSRFILVSACYL
jgi:hypothetical protein